MKSCQGAGKSAVWYILSCSFLQWRAQNLSKHAALCDSAHRDVLSVQRIIFRCEHQCSTWREPLPKPLLSKHWVQTDPHTQTAPRVHTSVSTSQLKAARRNLYHICFNLSNLYEAFQWTGTPKPSSGKWVQMSAGFSHSLSGFNWLNHIYFTLHNLHSWKATIVQLQKPSTKLPNRSLNHFLHFSVLDCTPPEVTETIQDRLLVCLF